MNGLFTTLLRWFNPKAAERRMLRKRIPKNLAEIFGDGNDYLAIKIASGVDSHYSVFHLWKDKEQTKQRQIEAPDAELKKLQRTILHNFLYRFGASPCSHGFVRRRSIVTNAALHTGKRFILKFDLKDFFPSVTADMIWREWTNSGLVTPASESVLRTLLNLCLYRNRLPQGAPTSPALANLVCRKLDHMLFRLARRHKMKYSRYADDLTFSTNNEACYRLIPVIKRLIAKSGFTVNEKKVNVLKRHQRQTVTGLVVNCGGRTGVKRNTRLKLRAYMHQILTGKVPAGEINLAKLRGHVAFLRHADPKHAAFFAEQLAAIEKMR